MRRTLPLLLLFVGCSDHDAELLRRQQRAAERARVYREIERPINPPGQRTIFDRWRVYRNPPPKELIDNYRKAKEK